MTAADEMRMYVKTGFDFTPIALCKGAVSPILLRALECRIAKEGQL
jgi:hypothetical protein